MSFQIDDDETARMVDHLAEKLGTTGEGAIRTAVKSALERLEAGSLKQRLDELRARYPLPPPTGLKADKAFYDELSGEVD